MNSKQFFAWRQSAFLLTVAAAAAFVALRPRAHKPTPGPAVPNEWRVSELVARLRARGFTASALAVAHRPATLSVFFCMQDRPAEDFSLLVRAAERGDRWRGIVFCDHCARPDLLAGEVASWGHYGFAAGPFVFFGDPELIAQVRTALGVEEETPRASAPARNRPGARHRGAV